MAKQKRVIIFCVVCKKNIEAPDYKEFRAQGHYESSDEAPSNLVAPDLGRSHRRHARKMKVHQEKVALRKEMSDA